MIKFLVLFLMLTNSVYAGLYESSYFEPVAACAIGGAAGSGLTDGPHEDKERNAATYCVGAALLVGVLNYHYFNKYYTDEFEKSFNHYREKKKRYKKAMEMIKDGKSIPKRFKKHFKVVSEVIEPTVDENGRAVEKKVIQRIELKSVEKEVGR